MRCDQWTFHRIQSQRIDEGDSAVAPDLGPAGEMVESPSLAAGSSTGRDAIDENKTRIGAEVKFLTLNKARAGEGLHRFRGEAQQSSGGQIRAGDVATGAVFGVSVDLGGCLGAQVTAGLSAESHFEMRLIAGDQTPSKATGASPHTFSAGNGCQQFHGTACANGSDAALAMNAIHRETGETGRDFIDGLNLGRWRLDHEPRMPKTAVPSMKVTALQA